MDHQYLAIAMQYYIAGRAAVVAQSLPVAGNLLHHAAEMFLKYLLFKSFTVVQMKQNFGHDLSKLWGEVKRVLNDQSLSRFDGTVSDLNQFEELRYPPPKGAGMRFSIYKTAGPGLSFGATVKLYDLCLEDVDEFVFALLQGRVTPEWIQMLVRNDMALEQYMQENRHPFFVRPSVSVWSSLLVWIKQRWASMLRWIKQSFAR